MNKSSGKILGCLYSVLNHLIQFDSAAPDFFYSLKKYNVQWTELNSFIHKASIYVIDIYVLLE